MENRILIVSGPSGVGKSTLVEHLLKYRTDFEVVRSTTDRPARFEKENYNFVSTQVFNELFEQNNFLETNVYAGYQYGTEVSELKRIFDMKKTAILVIDTNGCKQILERLGTEMILTNVRVASVFVLSSAKTIYQRLVQRNTESKEKIIARLEHSFQEIKDANSFYQAILLNEDSIDSGVHMLLKAYEYCMDTKSLAKPKPALINEQTIHSFDFDNYSKELVEIIETLKNNVSIDESHL